MWPAAFRRFFDNETVEFTYSCARDVFKGLVVVLCAGIFRFAVIGPLEWIGSPKWVVWTVEQADGLWIVATIVLSGVFFLAKLATKREPERIIEEP
jgi:hypothetical protein